MPVPTISTVPATCSFCPENVAVTVEVDYSDHVTPNTNWKKTASSGGAEKEMLLPAVLTASLQTTRSTATTQKHSASDGAAVTVCSASSKTDAFVVTGKLCVDYPIYGMLPREESFGGTAVERIFRVYLSADDVVAKLLFWEFTGTYEYGNLDLDNNSTTGADWNLTLRVAGGLVEPLWEGSVPGADDAGIDIFTDYNDIV